MIRRVLAAVGLVAAAYSGVVVIRLLGPSNAPALAWLLRELIFTPVAVILVLASWRWRQRFPVAWSFLRWFYGVTWTLFGLDFLLDNLTRSNPAGVVLSSVATAGGGVLLTSLWRDQRGRRMTTVVLDTNIYDKIVERGMTDDLVRLVAARRLRVLTTHVQRDELAAIPDVDKRQAVLRVPGDFVPTGGAIYGVSRYGQARYGGGGAGGLDISDVQKGNPKHSEDALIAVTAASEGCVLVTEDASLAKKVRAAAPKAQVWDFQTFVAHVGELLGRLP